MKKLKLFIYLFNVISCLFILTACGDSDNVPTYEGMSIADESGVSSTSSLVKTDLNSKNHHNNGHHSKEIETEIEDIVDIDVEESDDILYYVEKNETFVIEVHLSNPKGYEIQSFTLNGEKYANYMFKDGSTMELILIEVVAPSTAGYANYTIDAIKYIDGTDIKNADMSKADKSIITGVSYTTAPTAVVTRENITINSITLDIHVNDAEGIIGSQKLVVYLTDGDSLIAEEDLVVGDNSISFTDLTMGTTYEYGVATAYDFIDGNDAQPHWLLKNIFTTKCPFNIMNVETTYNSISFDIEELGYDGNIESITLYDSTTEEVVITGTSETRSFNELLSNHAYDLYLDFNYQYNGETISDWVCIEDIRTFPEFSIESCSVINTSGVSENASIYMRLYLNNPYNAVCTKVIINGVQGVVANTSTPNMLLIELINDGDFGYGNVELTIEELHIIVDAYEFVYIPTTNNVATVILNGPISVSSFELVDSDFNSLTSEFMDYNSTVYALVTFDNPTGYTIEDIDITIIEYYGVNETIISDFTKIDDDKYVIEIKITNKEYNLASCFISLSSFKYSSEYFNGEATDLRLEVLRCFIEPKYETPTHISSVSELLAINNSSGYYILDTDIDLSGIDWAGITFEGIFDGNGHTISNMTKVGTATKDNCKFGFFKSLKGTVKNLNIEKSIFMIDSNDQYSYVGMIAGSLDGFVSNCNVDSTNNIYVSNNHGRCGGLIGYGRYLYLRDCINEATVTSFDSGGLFGGISTEVVVYNCINRGNINATNYAGGVASNIGCFHTRIVNFTNEGNITSENYAAGITYDTVADFVYIDCVNNGVIDAPREADLIYDGPYYRKYL